MPVLKKVHFFLNFKRNIFIQKNNNNSPIRKIILLLILRCLKNNQNCLFINFQRRTENLDAHTRGQSINLARSSMTVARHIVSVLMWVSNVPTLNVLLNLAQRCLILIALNGKLSPPISLLIHRNVVQKMSLAEAMAPVFMKENDMIIGKRQEYYLNLLHFSCIFFYL